VLQQDAELVTAQSGRGVIRPHASLEPIRHLDQQAIPAGVTHRFVDDLEAVKVDEEHRGRVASRRCRSSGGRISVIRIARNSARL
jgi:hypothetical protein